MEWFIFSAGLFLPLLISPSVTNVLFQTCWQRQHVMALILFMLEMRGGRIVLILAFYPSLSLSSLTFLPSCEQLASDVHLQPWVAVCCSLSATIGKGSNGMTPARRHVDTHIHWLLKRCSYRWSFQQKQVETGRISLIVCVFLCACLCERQREWAAAQMRSWRQRPSKTRPSFWLCEQQDAGVINSLRLEGTKGSVYALACHCVSLRGSVFTLRCWEILILLTVPYAVLQMAFFRLLG